MAGYLFVLGAAVLWGMLAPISRIALGEGIGPLELAFWRAALGSLLFGAQAIWMRRVTVARADLGPVVLFGILCIAVFYGAYQMAIQSGGAALASVLLYTAPAIVAVLSWLILRESMGWAKVGAIALTLLGVAAISLQGGGVEVSAAALWWGLLSAATYALYYLFGKLYLNRYPTYTVMLYALPVGALGLAPLVDFAPKSTVAWAVILFMTVASTFGAISLYYQGLRRLEATRAAVVATLEPVVAAGVAILWLGERFSWLGFVGAGLVLAGVVAMVFVPNQSRPGR